MSDKKQDSENEQESENKTEEKNNGKPSKSLTERTSFLEWTMAAIGLIVVVFSIGYISYQSIVKDNKPPDLVVEVDSISKQTSGYLVEFRVENKGDETAANVVVEGAIKNGGEDVEKKSTTINYVASGSEQKAGLFFTENPEKYQLEIKAIGYENP